MLEVGLCWYCCENSSAPPWCHFCKIWGESSVWWPILTPGSQNSLTSHNQPGAVCGSQLCVGVCGSVCVCVAVITETSPH